MGNLIDLQSQIEKLQKQASDIRAKEFDQTVLDIVAQMQAFGISLKDLQLAMARRAKSKSRPVAKPRAKVAKTKAPGSVAAKYRGPNGESWTGRGLAPRWLSALIAQGRKKEEFAIQS